MKKLYFLILISSLFINAKTLPSELFNQIKESKSSLVATQKQKSITNRQLQKIAQKIKKLNEEIAGYDKKLDKLNSVLINARRKYQESMSEIKGIENIVSELDKDIEAKAKEFAKKLSRQLGSVVAQNQTSQKDEKSVVLKEVYDKYKDYNQQELLKLSRNIEQKKALRKNLLARRDEIAKSIQDITKQQELYKKEKAKKEQLLAKLAVEERAYSKKLRDIFKKQTVARLTLAKLNLLKEESAKEARKREAILKRRIKELKRLRLSRDNAIKAGKKVSYKPISIASVKQYGSSYTNNTYKYRGPKTIAPMRGAVVTKRFGSFIDPIYKIKSHSDSVTLISKVNDNRVYNVLNGEVAYMGRNSMLGKMVVIKHANGLYTIYADLNKFSPLLKVGSKVKKGSVVGKVKRKLIFEATKNGKFINPARLVNI